MYAYNRVIVYMYKETILSKEGTQPLKELLVMYEKYSYLIS